VTGRISCALLVALCLTSPAQVLAQQENSELGKMLAKNGMTLITTSWQPFIGPGSFIYIDWNKRPMGLGYSYVGKTVNAPKNDLPAPAPLPRQQAVSLASDEIKKGGLDLSFTIGKLNPGVIFGTGYKIHYDQTTFDTVGYDNDGASDALAKSPLTVASINKPQYSTLDDGGHRMIVGFGQAYFVDAIFLVKELHISAVKTENLAFALKDVKVGDCLPATPISEFKKVATSKQQNVADAGAGNAGAGNAGAGNAGAGNAGAGAGNAGAGNAGAGAGNAGAGNAGAGNAAGGAQADKPKAAVAGADSSIPDVTVRACRSDDVTYDLSITPGIPLGMIVSEIRFDQNNKPFVVGATHMKDFRDGMKHTD
jgi:hypothetical protein